jgi:hypothetical protein
VFALITTGMTEASITRSRDAPITCRLGSTTAPAHARLGARDLLVAEPSSLECEEVPLPHGETSESVAELAGVFVVHAVWHASSITVRGARA